MRLWGLLRMLLSIVLDVLTARPPAADTLNRPARRGSAQAGEEPILI